MTQKLSKAVITCTFSFTEGRDAEDFDAYELMRTWAHQYVTMSDQKATIFLDDQDLVQTEPWYDLKQVKINLPGRDEPYVSSDEMEEQYRLQAGKVSQAGFLRYILKEFDITYEYITTSAHYNYLIDSHE